METVRNTTAALLAPVMRLTGFRFSKEYRWGTTATKRFVYRIVNTIVANLKADRGWI